MTLEGAQCAVDDWFARRRLGSIALLWWLAWSIKIAVGTRALRRRHRMPTTMERPETSGEVLIALKSEEVDRKKSGYLARSRRETV
jgi:hypothetical protein